MDFDRGVFRATGPADIVNSWGFAVLTKRHKPALAEVLFPDLMPLLSRTLRGADITPLQFLALCSEQDRDDITSGATPAAAVRTFAESLAQGIRDDRIRFSETGQLVRHNGAEYVQH